MDKITILSENTDEIIALIVIIATMAGMVYQAVVQCVEISLPTEPAMLILGYYFGKKVK